MDLFTVWLLNPELGASNVEDVSVAWAADSNALYSALDLPDAWNSTVYYTAYSNVIEEDMPDVLAAIESNAAHFLGDTVDRASKVHYARYGSNAGLTQFTTSSDFVPSLYTTFSTEIDGEIMRSRDELYTDFLETPGSVGTISSFMTMILDSAFADGYVINSELTVQSLVVESNASVGSNVTVASNAYVMGDASVTGALTALSATTTTLAADDLAVSTATADSVTTGELDTSNLTATGACALALASVTGDVDVGGNLSVALDLAAADATFSNITVSGAATVGAHFGAASASVTGDTVVGGALDVTGDTDIGGALDVTGALSTGGALDVTGALSALSDAAVSGNVLIGGDVTASNCAVASLVATSNVSAASLTVSGAASSGPLDVAGAVSLTGALTAGGAATLLSSLQVTGDLTALSNVDVTGGATVAGDGSVGGALAVVGSLDVGGGLDVAGEAVLRSNAAVVADLQVGGALEVVGAVSTPLVVTDGLSCSGAAAVGSLGVAGDVVADGTVSAADFALLSDARYKTGVRTVTPADAWAVVRGVDVKQFQMGGTFRQGVIAQDVHEDYVVAGAAGLRVRYIDLLTSLFTCVQDLDARLRDLDSENYQG